MVVLRACKDFWRDIRKANMLRQKNVFRLMPALALIFVLLVVLTPQLFMHIRDVKGSIDFFEMSLEELMTIEVALADEPDVNRMNFFEMPLEHFRTIEVG